MISKNTKNLAKILKSCIYKFIYKKIKKVISVKKVKKIKIDKIIISKIFFYNIYSINFGRVFSNTVSDTAYLYKNIMLKEPSYQFRYNKKGLIINGKADLNEVLKYGTTNYLKKINNTVVSLLSGGAAKHNYWHWMFDTLPKIGLLQYAKIRINNKYFLAPSISQNFQTETLVELGIKKEKILNGEIYKHLLAKKIITTDHPVIFNNNPTASIMNIPFWIIKWLRKNFLKNTKTYIHYDKIFLDRKKDLNYDKRKIVNINEVKNFLKKNGFKIVIPEEYSFAQQVNFFNKAKIIVGIHGAAFTNIIFCKKNTKIIEFLTNDTGNQYKNLAKKCNLIYRAIIEINESKKLKYQNFHINVNILKLKKLLNL